MLGSSSWVTYTPQGVKGLDEDYLLTAVPPLWSGNISTSLRFRFGSSADQYCKYRVDGLELLTNATFLVTYDMGKKTTIGTAQLHNRAWQFGSERSDFGSKSAEA